jgi:hypothetical protein
MKTKPAKPAPWHVFDRRLAIGTVALMVYFAIAGAAAWLFDRTPVSAANAPSVSSPQH